MSETNEVVLKETTLRINEKGIYNSYLRGHLLGKGISYELIKKCLSEGKEVTGSLKYKKEGTRYFVLSVEKEADLPGAFILPSTHGPLGNKVSNWNSSCTFKFRHGRLVPVIKRKDIPDWLIKYATTFWVIVEKNELQDETLLNRDGPTEKDIEGSWFVVTAHFGPPNIPKPRVPKDCGNKTDLKNYLNDLDNWNRQQFSTVYIDLETDGQTGPCEASKENHDEIAELKKIVSFQQKQMEEMREEIHRLKKIFTKRMRSKERGENRK